MSEMELPSVKPHQHSDAPGDGGTLHAVNTQVLLSNNVFKLLVLIMALTG